MSELKHQQGKTTSYALLIVYIVHQFLTDLVKLNWTYIDIYVYMQIYVLTGSCYAILPPLG